MNSKYDVIIIGAGVGGLVCGNYLVKKGLKILIIEQYSKPGGYCTSFERKGYKFDVGVHYLGGNIKYIIHELNLIHKIKLYELNPSDKIIMPENTNYIYSSISNTIDEFQKSFFNENKSIKDFFQFIVEKNFYKIYDKTKKLTFNNLLDIFFKDNKLKSTLKVLLYNIGLSGKNASAISAIILYRDYILKEGYYPDGGMQKFSNCLADNFCNNGGEVLYNNKVVKILLSGNNKAYGIAFNNGEKIFSDIIVSNADATQTFTKLIDIETKEKKNIKSLICSPSIFAVYIGVNKNINDLTQDTCNIWYFNSYDVDKIILSSQNDLLTKDIPYLIINFPSAHTHQVSKNKEKKDVVQILFLANYFSKRYWDKNKNNLKEKIIKEAENLIPSLKNYIELEIIATPHTLFEYTLNKDGAAFGWASINKQIKGSVFPPKTSIKNLFLSGHWTTIGGGQGGIPKVIFTGKKVANLILNQYKKTNYE